MRKKTVKIAAGAVLAAAVWFYFSATKTAVPESEISESAQRSEPEVEQNVTSFSIEGRSPRGARQWTLTGDSARIIDDDIHMSNLKAVAYSDDSVINLSSNSGIYRRELDEVDLLGNVFVFSGEDFFLKTESARWSQEDKEIATEEYVEITREGMRAVGVGGRANSDERWAQLNSNVDVFIDPGTRVRSDGPLEVKYGDNLAVFRDNVIVEDEEGRLMADILTVEFDPETQKMVKVTAEGNVTVRKGNTYTISEKAVYTEGTKSAQLLGRPRIIIDPAEIEKFDEMMI